jgi:hypothetical protein
MKDKKFCTGVNIQAFSMIDALMVFRERYDAEPINVNEKSELVEGWKKSNK